MAVVRIIGMQQREGDSVGKGGFGDELRAGSILAKPRRWVLSKGAAIVACV